LLKLNNTKNIVENMIRMQAIMFIDLVTHLRISVIFTLSVTSNLASMNKQENVSFDKTLEGG